MSVIKFGNLGCVIKSGIHRTLNVTCANNNYRELFHPGSCLHQPVRVQWGEKGVGHMHPFLQKKGKNDVAKLLQTALSR